MFIKKKKKLFCFFITDFQIHLPKLFAVSVTTHWVYNIIETAKARIVKTASAGCDIFYIYNFFFVILYHLCIVAL